MKNYIREIKQFKKKVIEDQFFRPKWYSVFLNPYFINRNSLYKAMTEFSKTTYKNSMILDIGCGIKPYRNLFITEDYTGIDIQGGGHTDNAKTVDKFYDGLHIPYPDNSFDKIICTQVLEHADNPEILVNEMFRVLIPQGTVFISMPFTYPEHEIPFDYRRFTKFEHMRLLESNSFHNITITKTTGFFGTFGQLLVIFLFEGIHFRASTFKTILSIFVFGPIQIGSILMDKITNKSGQTMDYVITAKK